MGRYDSLEFTETKVYIDSDGISKHSLAPYNALFPILVEVKYVL